MLPGKFIATGPVHVDLSMNVSTWLWLTPAGRLGLFYLIQKWKMVVPATFQVWHLRVLFGMRHAKGAVFQFSLGLQMDVGHSVVSMGNGCSKFFKKMEWATNFKGAFSSIPDSMRLIGIYCYGTQKWTQAYSSKRLTLTTQSTWWHGLI